MRQFDDYVARNAERFLSELVAVCRQPSVSSTGEGMLEMARRTAELLREAGAQVEELSGPAPYPVWLGTFGEGARSVLFYDHYDVQPVGPLDLWDSPPFEPRLQDGGLRGRGVGDDKGEITARLQALVAYRQVFGELPIQVKFLVEGAHEIGSPGLRRVVEANRERLAAEAGVSEGLGRDDQGNFAIYLGCRGMAYLELKLETSDQIVASMYGGIQPNPAWRLAQALASIWNERGDLLIDGLADHVTPLTPEDLDLLDRIPLDEDRLLATIGSDSFLGGRSGANLLRRHLLEPFGSICSLTAGDPGSGLTIPGKAVARLDIRLVPQLQPEKVADLVRRHLARRGLDDIEVSLLAGVSPDRCPTDAPIVRAAVAAARDLTGGDPVVYPSMPAISASHVFHDVLGAPVLFAGAVTYPESKMHAPNENIRVSDYLDYVRYIGRLIHRLAG